MPRLTKFNPETNQYEYIEKAKTQAEYNEQRKAVIQRLGEYEDKVEWISVEERLPDPTNNVLVCKTFRGKPYIDIGCVKDAETCLCASDEYIIKPWLHKLTHWMPLPEPPKMKGECDEQR